MAMSRGVTPLFVSAALADQAVAFEEVDDGIWTVTFATIVLGRFDERQHQHSPDCRDLGGALRQLRWLRASQEERRTTMNEICD